MQENYKLYILHFTRLLIVFYSKLDLDLILQVYLGGNIPLFKHYLVV